MLVIYLKTGESLALLDNLIDAQVYFADLLARKQEPRYKVRRAAAFQAHLTWIRIKCRENQHYPHNENNTPLPWWAIKWGDYRMVWLGRHGTSALFDYAARRDWPTKRVVDILKGTGAYIYWHDEKYERFLKDFKENQK